MRKILSILTFFLSLSSFSQELNCNISVNSSSIQGTNKQIYTTLQEALNDFMNNTIWSNFAYAPEERVECNILIDISEQTGANDFKGKIQIQARRPVFGSSYNSVIFNYVDNDVQFTYQEFDPIEFSENTFVSNLSSLLSFYAYIILGLDSDTFELKGGDAFYQKAENILSAAQSSGYAGWQAKDDQKRKNRYWLINNLMDSEYQPLRNFYYSYHRLGLDLLEKSVDRGRAAVTESVLLLEKFSNNKPDPFTYLFTIILETKSNEFVDIYTEAPESEAQKVKNILVKIDPASSRKYNKIGQ